MIHETSTQILQSYLPTYIHADDMVRDFEQLFSSKEQKRVIEAVHAAYMKNLAILSEQVNIIDKNQLAYFTSTTQRKKFRNQSCTNLCEQFNLPASAVDFFEREPLLIERVLEYADYTQNAIIQQFQEILGEWASIVRAIDSEDLITQELQLFGGRKNSLIERIGMYVFHDDSVIELIEEIKTMCLENQLDISTLLQCNYMLSLATLAEYQKDNFMPDANNDDEYKNPILDIIGQSVYIPDSTLDILDSKGESSRRVVEIAYELMQTSETAALARHGNTARIINVIIEALEAEDQLTQRFSVNQAQKLLKSLPPNNNKNLPPSPSF